MITVIVPTFNRPDSLIRAVRSLFRQAYVSQGFTLLIVDNAPSASASDAIEGLRADCPASIDLVAIHEPQAGVANARNAAMRAVQTDLVAFLDDDQSAPEEWLKQLIANHERYPAAVTFGPVATELPNKNVEHSAYFEHFFAREPGYESGYIEDSFGCGNALIDFSKLQGSAPWFDARMNESGGEDDLLFERVRVSGEKFAWAADAPVLEHPLEERVSFSYTLKRAFSYGQAPITVALKGDKKRFGTVAFWMAVGAAKFVWHGVKGLALSAFRHPARAVELDRAVRGLAKVFWWVDFRFYGAAMLKEDHSKPVEVAASCVGQVEPA